MRVASEVETAEDSSDWHDVRERHPPEPRVYTPPTLRKLDIEERLIEYAGKWQMIRRRLDEPRNIDELEEFYSFCLQLMR